MPFALSVYPPLPVSLTTYFLDFCIIRFVCIMDCLFCVMDYCKFSRPSFVDYILICSALCVINCKSIYLGLLLSKHV